MAVEKKGDSQREKSLPGSWQQRVQYRLRSGAKAAAKKQLLPSGCSSWLAVGKNFLLAIVRITTPLQMSWILARAPSWADTLPAFL